MKGMFSVGQRRVLPFRQSRAMHPTRTLPAPLRGFVYLDDKRMFWGAQRKPAPKVGLLWVPPGYSHVELQPDDTICLGLLLSPASWLRLLRVPLGDIPPGVTDLDEIAPQLTNAIADLCDQAFSPAAAALAVERLLHGKLESSPGPDWLEEFADSIWLRPPNTRIADHSRATGFAATHVRRRFRRDFGLSPKAMQRLQRFNALLLSLHPQPWGLARREMPEFADQSHAIREFREFAAMTPGRYRRMKVADGDPTVFTVSADS
jgi:AraC-like DNA-binding protein